MATADDVEAKRFFIASFFEDLERKVGFLGDLVDQGHADEARLLCTTYLDGLGNWLRRGSYGSARNFCSVLIDHGGEIVLTLIVPDHLLEELPWGSAPAGAKSALEGVCRTLPANEAHTPTDFLGAIRDRLTPAQATWLESELWRGSVANAVYARVRSQSVHWLGSAAALAFSKTTYQGRPLPHVDLKMLARALRSIFEYARELSLRTNMWFGVA